MDKLKTYTLKADISKEELYSQETLPFGADHYALLVSESIRRDEDKRILESFFAEASIKTTPGRVYPISEEIKHLDEMCECECHDPNGPALLHCVPCCSRTYEKRSY